MHFYQRFKAQQRYKLSILLVQAKLVHDLLDARASLLRDHAQQAHSNVLDLVVLMQQLDMLLDSSGRIGVPIFMSQQRSDWSELFWRETAADANIRADADLLQLLLHLMLLREHLVDIDLEACKFLFKHILNRLVSWRTRSSLDAVWHLSFGICLGHGWLRRRVISAQFRILWRALIARHDEASISGFWSVMKVVNFSRSCTRLPFKSIGRRFEPELFHFLLFF